MDLGGGHHIRHFRLVDRAGAGEGGQRIVPALLLLTHNPQQVFDLGLPRPFQVGLLQQPGGL